MMNRSNTLRINPHSPNGAGFLGHIANFRHLRLVGTHADFALRCRRWSMILSAIAEEMKRRSKDDFKGRHFEALLIARLVQAAVLVTALCQVEACCAVIQSRSARCLIALPLPGRPRGSFWQ